MKEPNVLLIILDCVRPDRMSCYGYHKNTTPNMKMISGESTVFENAISVAPWTLPSHASIFTGLYPSEHGATTWSSKMRFDVKTLADIMSENAYETAAVCHNDGWISKPTGLAKGFNTFYGWNDILTPHILRRYLRPSCRDLHGLRSLLEFYNTFILKKDITSLSISICKRILKKNKNNPVFLFVNLLNAHFPYYDGLPTRSLKAFFQRTIEESRKVITGSLRRESIMRKFKQLATKKEFREDEFKAMNNLYDACIHYLDCQLGELFKFMRKEEIMDRTLLIITSDHGENIGDHKLIDHELSVHDSLIKVPLIIRYPDMFPKNKRIIRQVETRNIFHTILDVTSISIESTEQTKGNSFLKILELKNTDNYTFGEYSPSSELLSTMALYSSHIDSKDASIRRFVRTKDFKYVKYENGDEELYCLKGKERKLRQEEYPRIFHRLKNEIKMWEKNLYKYDKNMGKETLSEEEEKKIKERLKALGYLDLTIA